MQAFLITSTILFWTGALFAITLMFILRRTAEEEPDMYDFEFTEQMRDYTPDTNEEMHKYMNATPEEPSEIESHFLTHLDELNEQTNF